MAAKRDISMKIVLDGEREYKEACKNVDAALKNLKSETALVTAEYGKNTDSIDGLTAKQKIQQKECTEYEKAIEAAAKALEKFRTAGLDPSNESFQKVERNLNYNKAALLEKKQALEKTEKALAATNDTSKNYTKTVGEIDKTLSVLKAELDTITTSYKENAGSAEALTKKSEVLSKLHGEQAKKVDELSAAYEKTAQKEGTMSDGAVKLKLELEKAKQETASTGNQLRETEKALAETAETTEKTGDEIKNLGRAEDETREKTSVFGDVLKATLSAEAIKAGISAIIDGIEGIANAAENSVQQFGELEQNLGGSEAVFQDYASQMQKTGEDAYRNMGATQSQYLATANKMGALFQGSGIEVQKSAELTEKAMQRAADMASVMGIDVQVALDSVSGAAKGNYSMMDNLGISMNATNIEAYALAKGLDFTWQTATQAEKAEVAMQMFFENTEKYAGNFARESTQTISGSIGMLQAAVGSFTAGLGNANADMENLTQNLVDAFRTASGNIIPVLGNMAGTLPNVVKTALVEIDSIAPELIDAVGGLIYKMVEAAAASLPMVADMGVQILQHLADGMANNDTPIAAGAEKIISQLCKTILTLLPSITGMGIDIAVSLMEGIADMLPELSPQAVEAVMTFADTIVENIDKAVDAGINMVTGFADGMVDSIPVLLEKAPEIIEKFINAIVEAASDLIRASYEITSKLRDGIIDNLPSIGYTAGYIIHAIIKGFSDHIQNIVQIGEDVVSNLWNGISGKGEWLSEKSKKFLEEFGRGLQGESARGARAAGGGFGHEYGEGLRDALEEETEKVFEDQADAMNNAIPPVESLTDSYETLITAISNVSKESSKLQSAYQSLQKGEELSADNLLSLIELYPEVAQYIADTNDLTLDKGEILKTVLEAEKKHAVELYEIEKGRLATEIDSAKERIKVAQAEYDAKAKIVQSLRALHELGNRYAGKALSSVEGDTNAAKEGLDAETEALAKLENQLTKIDSSIAAVNAIELTYTATQGKSTSATKANTAAAKEKAAATKKLTEATEEYITATEKVISETEANIQKELEGATAEYIEEKEKQLAAEKEAADRKVKINAIALKRMEADTADSAEERAKLEKEYNELVLSYQTDYSKKNSDERKKTLEDQQKQYEELEKSVMEAVKVRNDEALEVGQYLLDRQVQAVQEATSEKISEYQREYNEKIKLIDEASQAEIRALQDKLDALNAEDQGDKAYENFKKLNELNEVVTKARMGDGDLAKALEAYDKEVKRQQDERVAAEKKAREELLQAQIKGIEDAAAEKRSMLDEQTRTMEEAYAEQEKYFAHIADLEIQIASTKNEELKKLLQDELDEYKRVNEEKVSASLDSKINDLYDEKINELKSKLLNSTGESEKAQLQKQLEELEGFKDEYFDNVTLLQERLNNLALEAEKAATLNKQKELAKQHYKELNESENLEAEAHRLIVKGNEDAVIALLSEYNEDWKKQGEDYPANMQLGMEKGVEDLTAYVNAAMKELNSGLSKVDTSKQTGLSDILNKDIDESEKYIPKYRLIGENISDTFKAGVSPVQKTVSDMTADITETISTGMAEVESIIRTKNDEVITIFDEYKPKWFDAGAALADSIAEGADFQKLIAKVQKAVAEINASISNGSAGGGGGSAGNEQLVEFQGKLGEFVGTTFYEGGTAAYTADMERRRELSQNLTVNFNQPVESPAETARAVKNAAKEMALDY